MEREEFIAKLKAKALDGDDLLHLPYTMSKDDVGRVLVEFYYMLLDCSEVQVTNPLGEIADTLYEMWED